MRSCFAVLPLTLLALCAGCQSGDIKAVVPIAGGGQITVPMTKDGPPAGEADGYKVVSAGLQPGKEGKDTFYKFELVANKEPALRRIRVEDISDDQPELLFDDQAPKFKDRHWVGQTDMLVPEDPRLKWVYQIPMSMRVYKFTLTRTDGTEVSFNHVSVYPPFVKGLIRAKWGEKY